MITTFFRLMGTGIVLSIAYVIWYWIGSDSAGVCWAVATEGYACHETAWSAPTIGGFRSLLACGTASLVALIWLVD